MNQNCSAILNKGMYIDNRNPSMPTAMKINRTGSISVLTQPIIFFRDSWFCIPMRAKLEDRGPLDSPSATSFTNIGEKKGTIE